MELRRRECTAPAAGIQPTSVSGVVPSGSPSAASTLAAHADRLDPLLDQSSALLAQTAAGFFISLFLFLHDMACCG